MKAIIVFTAYFTHKARTCIYISSWTGRHRQLSDNLDYICSYKSMQKVCRRYAVQKPYSALLLGTPATKPVSNQYKTAKPQFIK